MRMKLFDRHGRVRERALADHLAARPRRARRRADRARRRSPPDPLHLPERHPRHRLPRLGAPGARTTSASCICRRSAACAASPAAETQESFVGSDFTYEDIGGRELDDYTYAFADGENASWTPPPAARRSRPGGSSRAARTPSAEFPRVVSLVLKDSFVVVGADIYNRRNEKQKVYTVRRLEQIEGIWTVMDSEMTNALEKTRTELVVESTDYNVGLKESGLQPPRARARRRE